MYDPYSERELEGIRDLGVRSRLTAAYFTVHEPKVIHSIWISPYILQAWAFCDRCYLEVHTTHSGDINRCCCEEPHTVSITGGLADPKVEGPSHLETRTLTYYKDDHDAYLNLYFRNNFHKRHYDDLTRAIIVDDCYSKDLLNTYLDHSPEYIKRLVRKFHPLMQKPQLKLHFISINTKDML